MKAARRNAGGAGAPRAAGALRLAIALGGIAVAAGLWLLLDRSAARDAARAGGLPVLDAGAAATLAPGDAALVEGVLQPQPTAAPQGFLAFEQESYLGEETSGPSKGRQRWTGAGRATPSLTVAGTGGAVVVAADTYRMQSPPQVWQTDVVPRWIKVGQSTQRYRGFKAGDRVVLDGRRGAGRGEGAIPFAATVVFGGSVAEYRRTVAGGETTQRIAGSILLGAGTLVSGVAAWARRRLARAAGSGGRR